ncbi:MAG: glycogen/starch synthase [Bacteroidota bacterium]|jgi:starch synthase
MAKKKVLFISSEMTPYLQVTNVGELARRLPQAIQEKNNEIRVLMPRFGCINERRNKLHEVVRLSGINITIDDNDNPLTIKVASLQEAKMQVYFLDNEDYFHRKFVFANDKNVFYNDNDERTIFFCKGALETVKKLGWQPDIIHCQGWMTSLVPLYIKTIYKDEPVFRNAKVVYSVFENQFEESLGKDFSRKAGLNEIDTKQVATLAKSDSTALYITGITHADAIVKASDGIDAEVSKFIKKQKGKLMHDHVEGSYGDAYDNLYEELLQSQN